MSREGLGGWTLSNFMLFNSADAWPVPLLVARHRHSLSSRKFLCGTPEEFIDGGAEVSLRKRKWVGRSFVSRWMEEVQRWCLAPITILAGIRWIRVLVSRCSSSLANTENRKLRACLVDVRWEYRGRAAVDLDLQSACNQLKMSDNNRKEELEKKKARLQAMRWRDPSCLRY